MRGAHTIAFLYDSQTRIVVLGVVVRPREDSLIVKVYTTSLHSMIGEISLTADDNFLSM